jgi:hypothetical protein
MSATDIYELLYAQLLREIASVRPALESDRDLFDEALAEVAGLAAGSDPSDPSDSDLAAAMPARSARPRLRSPILSVLRLKLKKHPASGGE